MQRQQNWDITVSFGDTITKYNRIGSSKTMEYFTHSSGHWRSDNGRGANMIWF
jgi:hypothetical protein